MPGNVRFKTVFGRSFPLLISILPLVLSVALLFLRNTRSLGSFRKTVRLYRAQVSAIIQLISNTLGLLNILTVTTLVNYATRLRLLNHQTKLLDVGFFTTIALQKLDFSLSKSRLAMCIGLLAAAQIPGALWAGSLTPVPTHVQREIGTIKVPFFGANTEDIWNHQFKIDGNRVWTYLDGCDSSLLRSNVHVSTCPVPDYRQQLLDGASRASAASPLERNHSKIDSPDWIYHGRSYGFGSSLGVVSPEKVHASYELEAYDYLEAGYEASIHCVKNDSADFGYEIIQSTSSDGKVWRIHGHLPNTASDDSEDYPLLSWTHENENRSSPILGWAAVSHGGRNMIAITANERYPMFNRTQCEVFFEPTHKRVYVNQIDKVITARNITKEDEESLDTRGELEPTGTLTANVIRSIRLLSRMGTALYISDLGEPLTRNLRHVQNSRPANDENINELEAVQDFFTAMIDDLLVAFGAAQVHFANKTAQKEQPINGTFAALRFGKDGFIFSLAVVNLLLFALAVVEAVRTSFWKALPDFDPTKIRDVVMAMDFGARKCDDAVEHSVRADDTVEHVQLAVRPDADGHESSLLLLAYKHHSERGVWSSTVQEGSRLL
jgi:hypothetical protein